MRSDYYLEIERGERPAVHTRTYQKIADGLGISLAYIFGQEDETPRSIEEKLPPNLYAITRLTIRLIWALGCLVFLVGFLSICAFIFEFGREFFEF